MNTLLLSIILLLNIGLYAYLYYLNIDNEENMIIEDNNLSKENKETFFIEIKGAVENPGVYEVNNEMIINDIITLSGGLKKNAYTNNINLSKKVSENMVIMIYTKSEYKENTKYLEKTCETPSYDISNCIKNSASVIVSSSENENISQSTDANITVKEETIIQNEINTDSSVTQNTYDGLESQTIDNTSSNLININTASKEELVTLNGIGDAKAEAIIAYRAITPFTTTKDIINVSGISETIYEKIKDSITV